MEHGPHLRMYRQFFRACLLQDAGRIASSRKSISLALILNAVALRSDLTSQGMENVTFELYRHLNHCSILTEDATPKATLRLLGDCLEDADFLVESFAFGPRIQGSPARA